MLSILKICIINLQFLFDVYCNMECVEICEASLKDISEILKIQASCLLDNLFSQEPLHKDIFERIQKKGFLVHAMDEEYLQKLFTNTKDSIIQIVKYNNNIVGYIILYDIDLQDTQWWDKLSTELLNDIPKGRILYWKHVAISPDINIKGIWTLLENDTFRRAKQKGFDYLIIEIAKSIEKEWLIFENQRSMEYHTTYQWFCKIGEISYKNWESNEIWNLMLKKL